MSQALGWERPLRLRQFDGLTGLRGVGAVWVVAYHAQIPRQLPVLEGGYLAVDLFFILSGFVLSHAHQNFDYSLGAYARFLRDRVARIFPLNIAALLALLALISIVPGLYHDGQQGYGWVAFFCGLLLIQDWGFLHHVGWNVPAWSLSTEWLVSIGFPFFLVFSRRFRGVGWSLLGCAGSLATFALFLLLTNNVGPDVPLRGGMIRTALEFMAGCLLYRAYQPDLRVPPIAVGAAVLSLAVGISARPLGMLAVFAFPVIILLSTTPSWLTRFLSSRPMLLLGRISFSIYALHWLVLLVVREAATHFAIRGWPLLGLHLCGFAVVLAISYASFLFLEAPARSWIRGFRLPGQRRLKPV